MIFFMTLINDEDDHDLFKEIYLAYIKKMIYTAHQILGNYQDAEDAVHDTFIKIAKNIKTLQTMTSSEIFSYVIKATQNTAINMKKSQKKYEQTVDIDDCNDLNDKSALMELCTFENYEVVLKSLQKINPFYREVFYLYYIKELSTGEIAQQLSRNPDTVRKQLSRSKRMFIINFKEEIEQNGTI